MTIVTVQLFVLKSWEISWNASFAGKRKFDQNSLGYIIKYNDGEILNKLPGPLMNANLIERTPKYIFDTSLLKGLEGHITQAFLIQSLFQAEYVS